jgi:hypothetical protein
MPADIDFIKIDRKNIKKQRKGHIKITRRHATSHTAL